MAVVSPTGAVAVDRYVAGFRAWRLSAHGRLAATGVPAFEWPAATIRAACWFNGFRRRPGLHVEHDSPYWGCSCGIHAYSRLERAVATGPVVGLVTCWGHTIHHGVEGWRSEYARIIALAQPSIGGAGLPEESLAGLARAYGVPLVSPQVMRALFEEHTGADG